ncbi:MAG: class I SAM-dependent methyltransferase [Azonexus sp.]|nr:class I SAM-dependent methyltransferase [Azonexus sp.]
MIDNARMEKIIAWEAGGTPVQGVWQSEAGLQPPSAVDTVDDRISADLAWQRMAAGEALLWQGDWVNARHLLQALIRRAERRFDPRHAKTPASPAAAFALHREILGQRAALLARLLVPVSGDFSVPLRRAQATVEACRAAWGEPDGRERLVALRELLAVISAWEWRKKGMPVPAVQGRIYPHYGVFSPVRGEYVDLVAQAPLPAACDSAFDIGTGSGILAAILARRGVAQVLATDMAPRALACATENIAQLGLAAQVRVIETDLFPEGWAPLVVCNPPWVPAQPSSPVEYAVYDPDSRMLRGFLTGLAAHLSPGGEGWLIISDIAEHLGLRSRAELLGWIAAAGLVVIERMDTRPKHPKVQDRSDPLHAARAAEVSSLWRLAAQ